MATARPRIPDSLVGLTSSDLETVIQEAVLGLEDTQIARMYLLDATPQVEIGATFNLDRSTVSRRLSRIIAKLTHTTQKLHIT